MKDNVAKTEICFTLDSLQIALKNSLLNENGHQEVALYKPAGISLPGRAESCRHDRIIPHNETYYYRRYI